MTVSVLLVDDDRGFSTLAQAALQREGYRVTLARSLHEARAALEAGEPELVLLDRRLPDGDGLAFLPEVKKRCPTSLIVMVTAHGDIASAVDAIREGASDYVVKPVELPDLVMRARRALGEQRLRERLTRAETALSGRHRLVWPKSPGMLHVLQMLERISKTPRSPVLLLGPTGVGKEVLARHVHALSHDSSGGQEAPFVQINCAALPESTVESELFGHERGAFTDAKAGRHRLVEVANGGTLFLDEVGELPLALQAKLLTFLDSGRFRRLGGTGEQTSTARIVAATNRDLEADIRGGRFREDLWFRLSVFKLQVPPLGDRREDILPLAEAMLLELCAELGRRPVPLSAEAQARLLGYDFPGNVRELRNLLERALVLEGGRELELDLLSASARRGVASSAGGTDFVVQGPPITTDELDRRYAKHVLDQLGGRRMEAAKALGLSYPTFLKRIE